MKKTLVSVLTITTTLAIIGGVYFQGNGFEAQEKKIDDNAATVAHPEYAEEPVFKKFVKEESDAIVIGIVKSKGERYISVELGDNKVYSTDYTIEIENKLKDFKSKERQEKTKSEIMLSVLEANDPGLKQGSKIFVFVKETKPNHFVPLTSEFGLQLIENGQIKGHFIKKEHQKLAKADETDPEKEQSLNEEYYLNEVKSLLNK